jgi:hypothetical protein
MAENSLRPGDPADMTLFRLEPARSGQIGGLDVRATLAGGRLLFEKK